MIKNVLSSLFAVFLFAAGAVGAWYFVQLQQQPAVDAEMVPGPDPMSPGDAGHDPQSEMIDSRSSGSDAESPRMPVPVRGRSMSPEERFRFGVLYNDQIEEIKRREESLQEEHVRLQLVRKDLDQQKLEVEGILQQAKVHVEQSETLLTQVQEERRLLGQEKELRQQELEELKNARSVPTDVEQTNVKKWSSLLGGMNETAAAGVIRELANKGELDYALRILDSVEARDASKILDAIEDPVLLAEITEAFRGLKREQTKKRR